MDERQPAFAFVTDTEDAEFGNQISVSTLSKDLDIFDLSKILTEIPKIKET